MALIYEFEVCDFLLCYKVCLSIIVAEMSLFCFSFSSLGLYLSLTLLEFTLMTNILLVDRLPIHGFLSLMFDLSGFLSSLLITVLFFDPSFISDFGLFVIMRFGISTTNSTESSLLSRKISISSLVGHRRVHHKTTLPCFDHFLFVLFYSN